MSCERAGDAILDELGLTLRSSKAQVGKKFPKKRADVQRQDTLHASSGSISGPSNTNLVTSHAGTSSDVAQLHSTVDAVAAQMAWFIDKLCGDVADTPSYAENTDTDELPQAAGVSGTLVRSSRSGDPLSGPEMGTALTSLVDALALLGNVNLDMNQRRQDDQRGDINNAYKGLCKDGAGGSVLLYGDNLSTRIDDINRSNKVASSLGKTSANANTAYHPNSAFLSSRGRPTGRQRLRIVRKQRGMAWPFPWCFFRSGVPPLLARKIIPTQGAAPAHEISQSLPAKRSRHIDINTCNSKVTPLLYLASIPATNVQFNAGDTRLHHDEWRLLTSIDLFFRLSQELL